MHMTFENRRSYFRDSFNYKIETNRSFKYKILGLVGPLLTKPHFFVPLVISGMVVGRVEQGGSHPQ